MSFLPKKTKFNELMHDLSETVCAGPSYLKTYVETTNSDEKARAGKALMEGRLRSKDLAAQITQELCLSYITPFDRDDIQEFANTLYKIPKLIEKVRERLDMHNMAQSNGDFSRQIDVILAEAHAMKDITDHLVKKPDSRKVRDNVTVLYDLEYKGDAILGELLGNLFKTQQEARELILRKDIYDMLEKIIDRYRDAAGVALQIVLKHG
ncbi:MAG TPA: DUF47 family protein [Alphaproteobacteria bacterium]